VFRGSLLALIREGGMYTFLHRAGVGRGAVGQLQRICSSLDFHGR
jgi:hypothetical protein